MEPLTKKYRPKTWDEVIGNDALKKSLRYILSKGTHRAFLLTGPSGCGKTTIARLVAEEVGGTNWSIQEMNGGNDRGIDTIRNEIVKKMDLGTLDSGVKVYILDECHRLTKDAWEALLKPTEEPGNCYFVFATTEPEKLTKTILQRLMTYEVIPLSGTQIKTLITKIATAEGIPLSEKNAERIALLSGGSPRLATTYMEQAGNLDDGEITELFGALDGHDYDVRMLCRVFFRNQPDRKEAMDILIGLKVDAYKIRDAMLGYMFKVASTSTDSRKIKLANNVIVNLTSPLGTSKAGLAVVVGEVVGP
jgi:DNA polymerase III gamma/tau subunit